MTARAQPDGPKLFHGTRRGFTRGGWVTDADFHRSTEQTRAPLMPGRQRRADSASYTYCTTDERLAWAYAYAAPGRGAPKVLTVEARGRLERDPEHSVDSDAYRCDGWLKVLAVSRFAPFSEAEAAAGWVVQP